MNTELKVLIYRTGNEQKNNLPEKKKGNRTIIILKSSIAVLSVITALLGAVLFTRIQPVNNTAFSTVVSVQSAAEESLTVLKDSENDFVMVSKLLSTEESREEASLPVKNAPLGIYPAATLMEASAVSKALFGNSDSDGASASVYLLNDDFFKESIGYIPVNLSEDDATEVMEEEAQKEEKETYSAVAGGDDSIIELIDGEPVDVAKIYIPTTPEDLPSGLRFSYNEGMKLPLNDKEMNSMYQIVEAEAEGETVYGKMLVANVIINRVHDRGFGDNVMDVIFEKLGGNAQFAPTVDGRYWSVTPDEDTKEAVRRVLTGEDYSQGALFFIDRRYASKDGSRYFDNELHYLFRYGCHEFYIDD